MVISRNTELPLCSLGDTKESFEFTIENARDEVDERRNAR